MALTSFLFLVVFFSGIGLSIFRHPIYGLITYVLVYYLSPERRWWVEGLPELRWSLIAAILVLIGLIAHSSRFTQSRGFFESFNTWLILVFIGYLSLQLVFALDVDLQISLLILCLKYFVLMYLIYTVVVDDRTLRLFLLANTVGCTYWGWLAFSSYTGGRFEDFGADVDANGAGLILALGSFVAGTLLLESNWRLRVVLVLCLPFIVNGLITTLSRGAFLALLCGSFTYLIMTPRRYRGIVTILSILALILFIRLTNVQYWERVATIIHMGEKIENLDTGSGRLEILKIQYGMFRDYPMGTGHKGTMLLSPIRMSKDLLSQGRRASHMTLMSFLVDHGIVGAIVYVLLTGWCFWIIFLAYRIGKNTTGLFAVMVPTLAAIFVSITVADLTVNYLKLEPRFWFLALLMVVYKKLQQDPTSSLVDVNHNVVPPRSPSYLDWQGPRADPDLTQPKV